MSDGVTFQQLVASGDKEARYVSDLMNSPAYTQMNGGNASTEVRSYVSAYFARTFGNGPAPGSRQNNTVNTGTWRDE